MHLKVRLLRVRGHRLRWAEVLNGPAYQGDLVTYELSSAAGYVRAATLLMRDPAARKQLPDLYEPVLVGMATLALKLRGFERHDGPDGPYSVIQEWHCELP